jgi:hypothetical protein
MQGKQKKEQMKEKSKDTQVNMAVTQHDSIFKNISLPGGISSKATEYKELAAKGDKWESPIFSIGSAKETSSLPQAPKVTRKPHGRAGGYGSDMGDSRGTGQGLGASQGLNPSSGINPSGFDSTSQGYGSSQPGYGSSQPGYGSSQPGYGQSTGAGLAGALPGSHGTQQHGGQGFGTQVDNAFNNNPTTGTSGLGTSGLGNTTEGIHGGHGTHGTTGAIPPTGTNTGAPGSEGYNTTFGDQNPVFQGRV